MCHDNWNKSELGNQNNERIFHIISNIFPMRENGILETTIF